MASMTSAALSDAKSFSMRRNSVRVLTRWVRSERTSCSLSFLSNIRLVIISDKVLRLPKARHAALR